MTDIQSIFVSTHGAELRSLVANNREYLWQGDPKFWGRCAPILFPIVGRLANDTLRIDGEEYVMKQHGFARDAEFVQKQNRFEMVRDDKRDNYPYSFDLSANYIVKGDTLSCEWEVKNLGNKDLHFQIGAHPAFNMPDYRVEDEIHGFIQCYDAENNVVSPVIVNRLDNGLRCSYEAPKLLLNSEAIIAITDTTFANDAIIIEGKQVQKVTLFDKQGHEVLTVSSPQAESFGLWAPYKPGCPFVCIEPWCGIADRASFCGDISERECNHSLASGATYLFEYSIIINKIETN